MLFSVVVRISVLQLGQFIQIGSGPAIWAISIFRVYQTKFLDFLILKLNGDFEIEPTNAKWQSKMPKKLKLITSSDFTSFCELACSFWHYWKVKRSFLSNQNNYVIATVISHFFSKIVAPQLCLLIFKTLLDEYGKNWIQNWHGLGFKLVFPTTLCWLRSHNGWFQI